MPDRTFRLSKLGVGDALPCDVRDKHGTLLLSEGMSATSDKQLKTLLRNASSSSSATPDSSGQDYRPRPPLAMVLHARQDLQALFEHPGDVDFPSSLLQIAAQVRKACRANTDVALASILLCRDESYAIRHSVNAAIASYVTGRAMQLDAATLESIVAAALTMNIGMLKLQEQLQSLPGALTRVLRAEVEKHCQRGVAMLREYGVSDPLWLEIVRDHHERPDGSGYPAGKFADGISLPAQLVSLADIYCARVSDRAHRPAMQPNTALRWLFLNEGATVNEQHAALFIKTLGVYPPGTGVRLQNGSIGVVTQRGSSGQRPRVASITTQDGMRVRVPIRRSEDDPGHAVSEVVDLAKLGLEVSMEALWGADAVV